MTMRTRCSTALFPTPTPTPTTTSISYFILLVLVMLLLLRRQDHGLALYPCSSPLILSRRQWTYNLLTTVTTTGSTLVASSENENANKNNNNQELPLALRSYTKLAPLGQPKSTLPTSSKSQYLALEELAQLLTRDLTAGATGKGSYIVSGDLSTNLFRDDCVFLDPTNRVTSLSQYQKALTILFDPNRSVVELLDPLTIVDQNDGTTTIQGRFRSRGFLQLPWNPYITAYESNIVYKVGTDDGLIYEQDQTWSKSSYVALRETFTPTIFTPPPKSYLVSRNSPEPSKVTTLFDKVNGRRPGEYSATERSEIHDLMDQIVQDEQSIPWDGNLLPGTWQLVYFQSSSVLKEGSGNVDRRIPFPEFGFNDQYQIFGGSDDNDNNNPTLVNVGQVFGPSLFVRVLGTYQQVNPNDNRNPKQLQADIVRGQLCWGIDPTVPTTQSSRHSPSPPQENDAMAAAVTAAAASVCVELPIQGMGLFESWYLGERLRILQNLNGTGARGVQVRMH